MLAALILMGLLAPSASAHPLSTTAVLLDVNRRDVDVQIQLPVDRLAVAFDKPWTAASVLEPATLAMLRTYVGAHVSADDDTGRAWTTTIGAAHVTSIHGVDHLVLATVLSPSTGTVGDFTLHYDAILDRIVSHRIFVLARQGHTGDYTTIAMLTWQRSSVPVHALAATSDATGFVASLRLGLHHISTGSDHLLFLLMLLLPAPALAVGGRWIPRRDSRRAVRQVVHVVTAFAVGHSLALVLGVFDLLDLPTPLIESGIALSVLVSAVHAWRPLARQGETLIAGSFGVLHGLSFAAVINQLRLGPAGLLTDLLGFNLGIEIAQLLVVALVMPSLWVLSRTRAYSPVRGALAGLGAVLAAAWLAERTGTTSGNRLEPVSDQIVDHPLQLAAALAVVAAGSWALTRRTARPQPGSAVVDAPAPSPAADQLGTGPRQR